MITRVTSLLTFKSICPHFLFEKEFVLLLLQVNWELVPESHPSEKGAVIYSGLRREVHFYFYLVATTKFNRMVI